MAVAFRFWDTEKGAVGILRAHSFRDIEDFASMPKSGVPGLVALDDGVSQSLIKAEHQRLPWVEDG